MCADFDRALVVLGWAAGGVGTAATLATALDAAAAVNAAALPVFVFAVVAVFVSAPGDAEGVRGLRGRDSPTRGGLGWLPLEPEGDSASAAEDREGLPAPREVRLNPTLRGAGGFSIATNSGECGTGRAVSKHTTHREESVQELRSG